jgi:hypothetical protein
MSGEHGLRAVAGLRLQRARLHNREAANPIAHSNCRFAADLEGFIVCCPSGPVGASTSTIKSGVSAKTAFKPGAMFSASAKLMGRAGFSG